MFGISGAELLVLLLVAVLVVGPKGVAQALRAFRKAVDWGKELSASLREEVQSNSEGKGLGLEDLGLEDLGLDDLQQLDLSKYDPRQVIREAVKEEMEAWMKGQGGTNVESTKKEEK